MDWSIWRIGRNYFHTVLSRDMRFIEESMMNRPRSIWSGIGLICTKATFAASGTV
jgi:hypothetical protein